MSFNKNDFNTLLDSSKKRLNIKSSEPLYIKQYIAKINNYVQSLKANNENLTLDELLKIFEKDYIEILDTIFNNSYTLEYCMGYEACVYLSTHKDKFNALLEEHINNPENTPDEYSTDFSNNLKYFISELKKDYDNFLDSDEFKSPSLVQFRDKMLDDSVTYSEKNKICNAISSNLSFNTKKVFEKFVDCLKNGEFAFLKYEEKSFREDLQNNLINSISSVGTQLQKLGFLEKYPRLQENSYKNLLNIEGLSHSITSSKNNSGLEQLSNPNYLSTLSLDILLALNNFWCNRFIKEADTYFESIYSIHQLDLFPKMLDGSFNSDELSEEDLKNVFLKMNLFYRPMRSYWNYVSKNDNAKINDENFKNKDYVFLSNKELVEEMKENFEEQYDEYFKPLIPNSDLEKDLNLYWNLCTPILNAYNFKDSSILSTLALTQSLNLSPNYGIVLEDNIFTNNRNKSLNLWIDFKGLNFPLREHIPAFTLQNFLMEYNGNSMVPVYMDSDAFSDIPSHILFPLTKKQISTVKKAKKDDFKEYSHNSKTVKFLKHSAFLINPKSSKKSKNTIFFNLNDLEFYKTDSEGNYNKINCKNLDENDEPIF